MSQRITREQWLNQLTTAVEPTFREKGMTLPNLRVTCGWPLGGRPSKKGTVIGQCFNPQLSEDKTTELFISPMIADPMVVASTLVHELVHAAIGTAAGHGPKFTVAARMMRLEGKPTATYAGEQFEQWCIPILSSLGPYPHAVLTVDDSKKQSTRLLKVFCDLCEQQGEPYIARMTRKALRIKGAPICPEHHEEMTVVWPEGFDFDPDEEGV